MLTEDIENEFGSDQLKNVNFKIIRDPGVTGNFEVVVNNELIHSKKTKSDKFLHQNQKTYEAVMSKIGSELGQ